MEYVLQGAGFNVKDRYDLTSKNKRVTFKGSAEGKWADASLGKLPTSTKQRFLVMLGQKLQPGYAKKFGGWQKTMQGKIDALEATLIKAEDAFRKTAKKTPPSARQIEDFVKKQQDMQDKAVAKLNAIGDANYKKIFDEVMDKVYNETLSAMGDTKKLFSKKRAAIAWTIIKFIVAAAVITVGILTLPTGAGAVILGVAIAGFVAKGLSTVHGTASELKQIAAEFDTAIQKVSNQVSEAEDTLSGAIKQMRKAQSARDALTVKMHASSGKLEEVKKKVRAESNDAEVDKALKKLISAQNDIANLEKKIGGNPANVMAQLEAAKKALGNAASAMPSPTVKGSGSVGDILSTIDDAIGDFQDLTA